MNNEQDNTRCIINYGKPCPEDCLLRAQSANAFAKIVQELSDMSTKEKMTEKETIAIIQRYLDSMGKSPELKEFLIKSGITTHCFLESEAKKE